MEPLSAEQKLPLLEDILSTTGSNVSLIEDLATQDVLPLDVKNNSSSSSSSSSSDSSKPAAGVSLRNRYFVVVDGNHRLAAINLLLENKSSAAPSVRL